MNIQAYELINDLLSAAQIQGATVSPVPRPDQNVRFVSIEAPGFSPAEICIALGGRVVTEVVERPRTLDERYRPYVNPVLKPTLMSEHGVMFEDLDHDRPLRS